MQSSIHTVSYEFYWKVVHWLIKRTLHVGYITVNLLCKYIKIHNRNLFMNKHLCYGRITGNTVQKTVLTSHVLYSHHPSCKRWWHLMILWLEFLLSKFRCSQYMGSRHLSKIHWAILCDVGIYVEENSSIELFLSCISSTLRWWLFLHQNWTFWTTRWLRLNVKEQSTKLHKIKRSTAWNKVGTELLLLDCC